ncbi:Arm DNA-binding domain-containing protein [Acinetobacter ursingii]|uniref:Arm DNA-binding domain-containing protein n=1 Tax=Acinetobacter ursingii TaxID=108980 RepID=UPI00300B636B
MAINTRNGMLYFDFKFNGQRCREYTKLKDTTANRKKMQKVMDAIEAEIMLGAFCYAKYFPNSKKALATASPSTASKKGVPTYQQFTSTWFEENKPLWRNSHTSTVNSTIQKHLIPWFGNTTINEISKEQSLQFRAQLVNQKGRSNQNLASKTINRIMQIHGQIMAEASERYSFVNPTDRIKRLKQRRVDVQPFSLAEVQSIINEVRDDFRDYMIVRFFTGMRTGEIHGLQWKYIDFERRQILIRSTWVRGSIEYTKTDGSQREIDMSSLVYDALKRQECITKTKSDFVFCNKEGQPYDLNNITNRVWYPLLAYLGLDKRRPYQTRHTAATLWLGSGENPEWVARQLGHNTTEMLFRTYSRFIPNLTRQDGAAMNNLLSSKINLVSV